MRVLITGSDGYLGALVAPYLCAHGFEVVGLETGQLDSRLFWAGPVLTPVGV